MEKFMHFWVLLAIFGVVNGGALNVAVIGAGMSGLGSAKYSLDQGYNVTIYEQSEGYGGVWRYTDQVGKDQYGIDIHTAMYQGLRTNIPYQLMEFHDFPYPSDTISFPPQAQVLSYIHSYVDHFNLSSHIQLNHHVVRVTPIENDKWEVIVKDLPANEYKTLIYDVVFVANGHFSTPKYPVIPGIEDFKGKVLHSHDYRSPEPFQGESVLIIGGGPSGIDLVVHLSKIADRITFSQHKRDNETSEQRKMRQSLQPPNVFLQDNVKRFTAAGAEFIDGTHQTFSVILFATGYHYTFPFLTVDTGITTDRRCVLPLYKQVFNIEHPTMAFIGAFDFPPSGISAIDLQIRFAMKFITGEKKLPSKAEMMEDMHVQNEKHCKLLLKNFAEYLEMEKPSYMDQLSEAAGIEAMPKVMFNILLDTYMTFMSRPSEFRNFKYIILDDNTFIKERSDGGN